MHSEHVSQHESLSRTGTACRVRRGPGGESRKLIRHAPRLLPGYENLLQEPKKWPPASNRKNLFRLGLARERVDKGFEH